MFELSPLVTAARDDGLVGPGPVEVVTVEARAHDGGPGPVGGEPPEGLGVAVDDGHRVALLDQPDAQAGTDPATTHDDDVHPNHATRIAAAITTHPPDPAPPPGFGRSIRAASTGGRWPGRARRP